MPITDRGPRQTGTTDRGTGIAPRTLYTAFFTGPARRVLSRQRRHSAQILVVQGGVYVATVDTPQGPRRIRAQVGDVVCWPVGSENTDESEPGKPLRCVNIQFQWPGMPSNLPFTVRDTEHVIDLLANRLLARAHDPLRKGVLDAVADAYLAAILAEFIALAEDAEDDLVVRVARYVEEHMKDPIRRTELARHVGMDPDHFGRRYRALTGRTPIQDIRRRKAAYAKHVLLMSPDWSLDRIAKLAGVRNGSKLSCLLKQYAGVSAREIKRAARAASRPTSTRRRGILPVTRYRQQTHREGKAPSQAGRSKGNAACENRDRHPG